jgi:hypothetical protein
LKGSIADADGTDYVSAGIDLPKLKRIIGFQKN